jgi:hypothetical protein
MTACRRFTHAAARPFKDDEVERMLQQLDRTTECRIPLSTMREQLAENFRNLLRRSRVEAD